MVSLCSLCRSHLSCTHWLQKRSITNARSPVRNGGTRSNNGIGISLADDGVKLLGVPWRMNTETHKFCIRTELSSVIMINQY